MSNMTNMAGTTVTNISGSSRKFYRVFTIDNIEIRQWGRIGTTGQFKFIEHHGKRDAETSAANQIRAKLSKGYGGTTSMTFGFDADTFRRLYNQHQGKAGQAVAAAYEAAEARSAKSGANYDHLATDEFDDLDELLTLNGDGDGPKAGLDAFAQRALEVVTAAATGSAEAAVGYAHLRDEFGQVQEQYERCESLLETIETMLQGVDA